MKKHLKNKIISLMKEILISYKEYKDGDPVFLIENEAEASSFSEKLRKDMLNTKTFLPQAKKWLAESREDRPTGIVVWDFPDNFARNDDWGSYIVFFVVLVDVPWNKKSIAIFKKEDFSH